MSKILNIFLILALLLLASPAQAVIINIYNIQVSQVTVGTDGGSVEISWRTEPATYGSLQFGSNSQQLDRQIKTAGQPTNEHKLNIGTLRPNVTYYFQITAFINSDRVDSFVRSFKTPDFKLKTTTELSRVSVIEISGRTATINWQTDLPADGRLIFGTNSNNLTGSASHGDFRTSHQLSIRNLQPATRYYYQVISKPKDGQESRWYVDSFRTNDTDLIDREPLVINNLEPSTVNAPNVTANSILVTFSTSRITKANLSYRPLNGSGGKNLTDQNDLRAYDHRFELTGLSPQTTYLATLTVTDVNDRKIELKDISLVTKAAVNQELQSSHTSQLPFSRPQRLVKTANSPTVYAIFDNAISQPSGLAESGWFGSYYDHDASHPEMANLNAKAKADSPFDHDWYEPQYLRQTKIDPSLDFGYNWYPLDDFKADQPHDYLFAVRWSAEVTAPSTGPYTYHLQSDDDSWILVNDQVVVNNSGLHVYGGPSGQITLQKGVNNVEIFYAERFGIGSGMVFKFDDLALKIKPLATVQPVISNLKPQRYAIMTPEAFTDYNYDWRQIETVEADWLAHYQLATLARLPDDPTVYYLDPARRLKLALPNEAIFNSYGFDWQSILVINQADLYAYYDTQLVKGPNSPTVYLLTPDAKRPLTSESVLHQLGFDLEQVVTVSRSHLDYFLSGQEIADYNLHLVTVRSD